MNASTKKVITLDIAILLLFSLTLGMMGMGIFALEISITGLIGDLSYVLSTISAQFLTSIDIMNMMYEFRGEPVWSDVRLKEYWPMIILSCVTLIFTLILIPYFFRKTARFIGQAEKPLYFYVGGGMLVFSVITHVLVIFLISVNFINTVNSAGRAAVKDGARSYLTEIGFTAANKMLISGLGTSSDIAPEQVAPILEELNAMDTDQYEVVAELKDQSTLLLHVVSDLEGRLNSYKNSNGESGKFEAVGEVDLNKEYFFQFRNDLSNQ
ncbi:hypothetical protein AB2B38_007980 [Balneola sp. MJW-20]|uniref:hypothetical protein n=1 Tax=Gracilimonas aurantiaca TaxID=3234185 RepID=UPI0034673F2C